MAGSSSSSVRGGVGTSRLGWTGRGVRREGWKEGGDRLTGRGMGRSSSFQRWTWRNVAIEWRKGESRSVSASLIGLAVARTDADWACGMASGHYDLDGCRPLPLRIYLRCRSFFILPHSPPPPSIADRAPSVRRPHSPPPLSRPNKPPFSSCTSPSFATRTTHPMPISHLRRRSLR